MPVGQYHREYDTTWKGDRDINPAPRSNIPMEQATWSAKHMINSIYGVNGNVPNQKMAEKMIDIWKMVAKNR